MHGLAARRRVRALVPACTAAAAVLVLAAASPAPAASPRPAARAVVRLHRLLNAVRADHGAPPLRRDRTLARVARRHSRDMILHHYFAHDSRSGARFSARILRTGWARGRRHWRLGENLAWGSGRRAAARSIVQAWLRSPAHRRILLDPGFRVVGIGIARGTPVGPARRGRTYTTDFGS
jgi:uncharacterized protein YkwD